MISDAARAALDELVARDDPTILGLVLSGSAARGMATERSDVDVYVVRDDAVERETSQSPAIDEIPISLADLEDVSTARDRRLVLPLVLRLRAGAP